MAEKPARPAELAIVLEGRGRQAGGDLLLRRRIGPQVKGFIEVVGLAALVAPVPVVVLPGRLFAAVLDRLGNIGIQPQIRGLVELLTVAEDRLAVQRFSPSRDSVYQI